MNGNHYFKDDEAMRWMDESVVRYAEHIHQEHGGAESIFRSKRLDRFAILFLLVMIIFSHRLQLLLLSWSTGLFFSLLMAWLSVVFTLFELFIVNTICLVLKLETLAVREKLIAQIKVYAEPVSEPA